MEDNCMDIFFRKIKSHIAKQKEWIMEKHLEEYGKSDGNISNDSGEQFYTEQSMEEAEIYANEVMQEVLENADIESFLEV